MKAKQQQLRGGRGGCASPEDPRVPGSIDESGGGKKEKSGEGDADTLGNLYNYPQRRRKRLGWKWGMVRGLEGMCARGMVLE